VRNIFVLMALAFMVSGCASISPASIRGGECRAFRDPGFAVRGKRLRDDQWVGKTQETGIEICHWRRPTARPASFDARPVRAAPVTASVDPTVVPTPPKKRHWYDKFRRHKPTP
jgi:hypothetical protein